MAWPPARGPAGGPRARGRAGHQLDEAQALKNAQTQRWKAARDLSRAFTLASTGTPIENRLDELWALTALVVPGLFGDAKAFRAAWSIPIERDGAADLREALSRRIRPFLLRRTKSAVAPELPDRTTIDLQPVVGHPALVRNALEADGCSIHYLDGG